MRPHVRLAAVVGAIVNENDLKIPAGLLPQGSKTIIQMMFAV
jgi:hypothetical protein